MDEKFIEVKQLYKTFHTKKQDIEVLKGIDLSVGKGDIYGIVGFSGAGKSTLVRCINRLEEPDSGSVRIGDQEITSLGKAQLNRQRRKIGMIFQQFNLFDSMTVAQNIAYPLKMAGASAKEIGARVDEMLALVGLTEKRDAYPGELSGGQKQRVGIGESAGRAFVGRGYQCVGSPDDPFRAGSAQGNQPKAGTDHHTDHP